MVLAKLFHVRVPSFGLRDPENTKGKDAQTVGFFSEYALGEVCALMRYSICAYFLIYGKRKGQNTDRRHGYKVDSDENMSFMVFTVPHALFLQPWLSLHQALRRCIITERIFSYLKKDIDIYRCTVFSHETKNYILPNSKNFPPLMETGSS
jgi:hypothetical protein